MSLIDCVCPAGVLDVIVSNECKTHILPKIARVHFQKFLTSNNFVDGVATGINTAAAWAGLTSSGDDTQVSVSPLVSDGAFGEAEVIEGSENFEGATMAAALRPPEVTIMIEDPTPAQTKAINAMFCADSGATLGIAFVFANDSILVNEVTDTPLTHSFFPVSAGTFTPGTPNREGVLGSSFNYTFSFKLSADWYDNSAVVKPEAGFSYLGILGV